MTRMAMVALVVAAMAACGGESPPSGTGGTIGPAGGTGGTAATNLLIGNWLAYNPGDACGLYMDFPDATGYVLGASCVLSTGPAITVETGTYAVVGKRIVWTAEKSTCSETSKEPAGADFVVTSSSLQIAFTNEVASYARNNTPPSSGVVTLGCIRNMTFVPSPIAPL